MCLKLKKTDVKFVSISLMLFLFQNFQTKSLFSVDGWIDGWMDGWIRIKLVSSV
jgi:hypothetical protein